MGTRLATALFATMLTIGPAFAQTSAPQPNDTKAGPTVAAVIDACQADLKSLCGGEPFPGGLMRCMRQNRDKLSQNCQSIVTELRRTRRERREALRPAAQTMRQACEADVKTLCGDVQTGQGRLMRCMRENREKVSEACKTAMSDMRRMMRDMGGRTPRAN